MADPVILSGGEKILLAVSELILVSLEKLWNHSLKQVCERVVGSKGPIRTFINAVLKGGGAFAGTKVISEIPMPREWIEESRGDSVEAKSFETNVKIALASVCSVSWVIGLIFGDYSDTTIGKIGESLLEQYCLRLGSDILSKTTWDAALLWILGTFHVPATNRNLLNFKLIMEGFIVTVISSVGIFFIDTGPYPMSEVITAVRDLGKPYHRDTRGTATTYYFFKDKVNRSMAINQISEASESIASGVITLNPILICLLVLIMCVSN